jgi:phospholipid transport system substrate-binding protein
VRIHHAFAIAAVLCALFAPAAQSTAKTPDTAAARAAMEKTVADVLAVLKNGGISSGERRGKLEAIALDRFDFTTMARLVLKRDWLKFSPEQQAEFVDAFRTYLANSYGTRIERYNQEEVVITGERAEKLGDVTVHTKIIGGKNSGAMVDYRLRENGGHWRVIDVVIEGVSLVANFRAQFSEVLARGGPTELLQKLHQRNEENAAWKTQG